MSRRIVVAVLVAVSVAVAACERPTAPEGRELARQLERKASQGDVQAVSAMFSRMGSAGFFVWGSGHGSNHALTISRDGRSQAINAYVLEEIHLAPDGVGAPVVRRTLVGWPDDHSFGLYALTDHDSGAVHPAQSPQNVWRAPRFLAVNHVDTLHSWVPRSGYVNIGPGVPEKSCGLSKEQQPYDFSRANVECEIATYDVSARGEFLRQVDAASALTRSIQKRHHLSVAVQRVPGVRFTTTCPKRRDANMDMMVERMCMDVFQFWRDNRLFAPALGVDVHAMSTSTRHQGWYVRTLTADGPSTVSPGFLRWTINTPDGRLLERDSIGPTARPPRRGMERWLLDAVIGGSGRRVQAIASARIVDSTSSEYAIVVVDLERGAP